jgi:chemotaxis protein CheD
MKLARVPGEIIVTHALGSCIGITVHDPVVKVGGMLHYMLPDASVSPDKAAKNPWMFASTGIPLFFEKLFQLGAVKSRLVVKVAGGSQLLDEKGVFAIGKRNHTAMRKLLWQQGILVKAEHVGGTISRTLYLEIGRGRVWLTTSGKETEL